MNNSSGKQMKDPSLVENFDGTAQNANIGGYAGGFGTSYGSALVNQITSSMSTINANFFTKGFSNNIATNMFLGYWPSSIPSSTSPQYYLWNVLTNSTLSTTAADSTIFIADVWNTPPAGSSPIATAATTLNNSASGMNTGVTTYANVIDSVTHISSLTTSTINKAWADINISDTTIRDVNSMWYYQKTVTLVNYLQGLYAWHNLLIPTNWANFTQGNPTKIYVPDIPTRNGANSSSLLMNTNITLTLNTNNNTVTAVNTDPSNTSTAPANFSISGSGNIVNIMSQIIPFPDILPYGNTINIYVMRQLFFIYIQLTQYTMATELYIIMVLGNGGTSTTQNTSPFQSMSALATILKTIALDPTVYTTLLQITQDRVTEYSKSTNTITNLNNSVSKEKTQLVSNEEKIAAQNKTVALVKKYEIVAITVLCIVLALSCGLIIYPLEYTKKLTFGLLIVLFAIVSSFTISMLFNKSNISTVETFTGATDTNATLSATISSNYGSFYGLVVAYFTNIINNTNALQSYNLYGNVNYALQKEQNYYNDTNKGLINVNSRMDSIYKISFLDQTQKTALMNFLLSVSIISAATVMAYVAIEKYQNIAKYVLAFGLFLIAIALILYILEVTQRVRTDGNKIYWGAPTSDTLNRL